MKKEVFERLLTEFNELDEKITKLREFLLDEEKVKVLDNLNKDLLISQLKAMEAYISILSIRIGYNAPRKMPINKDAELVKEEVKEETKDAE